MSATIQPETILRELAELWVSLGKESDATQSSGVLRACAMTLVTVVEESEDTSDVWSVMAALMPEHPSRAIVIRFRPSAERALSSRVFSQCWMPFGQRRQICCEQIEIMASDASLPDLPAVILPLAVADLPVVLWCRGARLFNLRDFPQLDKIANRVVVDSGAFGSPAAILGRLDELTRSGRILADLAWTRLTRWRELVAQIFENRSYLARLAAVRQVRIGFGGAAPPSAACYLAAWLLDCLENAGTTPSVSWGPVENARDGEITRVELMAPDDGGIQVSIRLTGDGERQCAEVRVNTLGSRTLFAPDNDYTLLRQELSIPGRDPVFEKTLARAARMASTEKL
ncbi:MAG: glucose-6-phosphate dehydrogenase assembly protein OpcA [Acidobacteriia bacterium]|nr:glucose-6-phosphate dehydrogenase assembly protein OpcA [Terriglobia bacterium]